MTKLATTNEETQETFKKLGFCKMSGIEFIGYSKYFQHIRLLISSKPGNMLHPDFLDEFAVYNRHDIDHTIYSIVSFNRFHEFHFSNARNSITSELGPEPFGYDEKVYKFELIDYMGVPRERTTRLDGLEYRLIAGFGMCDVVIEQTEGNFFHCSCESIEVKVLGETYEGFLETLNLNDHPI